MRFIIKLTAREIRYWWRSLIFFFLCIAIGVAAIAGLRSLMKNLNSTLAAGARSALTADVEISSSAQLSPAVYDKIETTIQQVNITDGRSTVLSTTAMARTLGPNGRVAFVELRGVDDNYPLVGSFTNADGSALAFVLKHQDSAIVSNAFLKQLDASVGDEFQLANKTFRIAASFESEPGAIGGFQLGPRVYIRRENFEAAGLVQSSRVRQNLLLRTYNDPTPLVEKLRQALKGEPVRIRSYKETEENLGEQFARAENYFSLVGLLILVLGGVGVWNVSQSFIDQKKRAIAIMKCLGASNQRVYAVYFAQMMLLAIAGSVGGLIIAQACLWVAGLQFSGVLPAGMSHSINPVSSLQAVLLGLLISAIFSSLPLLKIKEIQPRILLREHTNEPLKFSLFHSLLLFLSLLLIAILSIWQAGSLAAGVIFLMAALLVCLGLFAAAAVFLWILKRVGSFGPFILTQGINSLKRPGNQTKVVIIAIGLGIFVVSTVYAVADNLLKEFNPANNSSIPSLFFIDIQPSQVEDFKTFIKQKIGEEPELLPAVRGRITHINGRPIDFSRPEIKRQQGQIGREFAITYRNTFDKNESLISGRPFIAGLDFPEVSVEDNMAERLGIEPGDSITFEISGRRITARVANIRRINLRNSRNAFVFVFSPGFLESAPKVFAANTVSRLSPTERQILQRDVVLRFSNIQVIDVLDILSAVQDFINKLSLGISFIGIYVALAGFLILFGTAVLTRRQRIYEYAVLKTLGTDRLRLAGILFTEYFFIGLIAAVVGISSGLMLSWVSCSYLLNIDWDPPIAFLAIAGIAAVTLVTISGAAACFDLLFKRPLETLRLG